MTELSTGKTGAGLTPEDRETADLLLQAFCPLIFPMAAAMNRVTHDTQSIVKPFVDDPPDPGVSDAGQETAREERSHE